MAETTRRLLLVEHNQEIAHTIQQAFAAQGSPAYQLTCVGRLEEALRHLEHHAVDLALLNLHLSDAKGLSTLRRVLAAAPGMPVIVLAGGALRDLHAVLREGAADVLPLDGLDPAVLRHVTATTLARRGIAMSGLETPPDLTREVEGLLAAMRSILVHRDFDGAAREIFRVCKSVTGATVGFIALLPAESDGVWPIYLDTGTDLEQMQMNFDGSVIVDLLQDGTVVYENDFPHSPWAGLLPAGYAPLTNVLFTPLLLAGTTIGVLALGNKAGVFTDDDARAAREFGEIASFALHSSRLLGSLESSEERLRSVVESATDAIICIDSRNTVISWNRGAELMFGYEAYEMLGKPLMILPDPFRRCHEQMLAEMVQTGVARHLGKTLELTAQRKNGTRFPIELSLSTWNTGEGIFFTGIIRDISERRAAEREQRRVNTALAALSDCNQALIRATDEAALLQAMCTLIVAHGNYRLAWISYLGGKTADGLQIKAIAHHDDSLSRRSLRNLGNLLQAQPFVQAALERGEAVTSRCLEELTVECPWREAVLAHDFHAAIAVPLMTNDTPFGMLVIFSDEDGFEAKEATLLSEMAVDLCYGIDALRVRRRHQQAEKALEQSKAKYYSLFEQMEEGFALYAMIYDKDGQPVDYRILDVNPAYEQIMAIPRGRVVGHIASEVFASSAALPFSVFAKVAVTGQPEQFRTYLPELDKFLRVSVFSPRPGEFATFFADITAHRRAETEVQEGILRLRRALEGTVSALAATTERRDPYTAGHQQRVAQLACTIAHEMGFSEEDIEQLRIAALLHDIGKIAVPIEILTKPGKITPPEFSIIKDHAQVGYEILKEIDFPWPVALLVLQHHGRLDGSGYPDGLNETAISMLARILCVSDVVEAMSSHRPYRPALGVNAALQEIASRAGAAYDADVVAACLRVFSERGFSFE